MKPSDWKRPGALRLLVWLRFVAAGCYVIALVAVSWIAEHIALPSLLWTIPLVLLAFNVYFKADANAGIEATPIRLACHLAVDTGGLFFILWFTGGAANPFVSLFLLPVAMGGVLLPPRYSAALSAACIGAYSLLLMRYLDGAGAHIMMTGFTAHVVGMWLNFVGAAVILTAALLILTAMLRERERELADQRERLLRDDAIVSVATLTAGAAHALNTPLGTITLAAEALGDRTDLADEARADVETIAAQAQLCAQLLQRLVDRRVETRSTTRPLADFADALMQRWRDRRPEIEAEVIGQDALESIILRDDPALAQALLNLLDNASDASLAAGSSRVRVAWSARAARAGQSVRLYIDDKGPATDLSRFDGAALHSTKVDGLGLGLTLARASIVRLGGTLSFERAPGGGTRAIVELVLCAAAEARADSTWVLADAAVH